MHRGATWGGVPGGLAALACGAALAWSGAYAHHHGVERVRFQHYEIADGLSQLTVRALAQDNTGFIWLGTQDGLNRFDGYAFRVYRHDAARPGSLADNHVTALAVHPDGGVWAGLQSGGISRYLPATDSFQHLRHDPLRSDSLASDNVAALLVDRSGRLLAGSSQGALQRLKKAGREPAFERLRLPAGAEPGPIRALAQRGDGSVLVGTRGGLWLCPADSLECAEEWRTPDGIALNVYDIELGAAGEAWVATADRGLVRFDAGGKSSIVWRAGEGGGDGLVADSTRSLELDAAGRLWVGTDNGLSRVDGPQGPVSSWRHDPVLPDSLASNRIYSMIEDRDGLIWVGTWLNGANVFDPRIEAFLLIRPESGDPAALPAPAVRAVHVDPDGTMWMGVLEGGGLLEFDLERGVRRRYTHDPARPESLVSNNVQYVTRSRDGRLWVGTTGGLDRLLPDGSGFEHFRHDPADPTSLASDSVVHLHVDRQDTLWVGMDEAGLDALCSGCTAFRHYARDPDYSDSLGGDTVFAILESSAGELWVGLRPGGLDLLDRATGRITHHRQGPRAEGGLSNDAVTSLFEDSRRNVWVGTQGGGVNRVVRDAQGGVRFQAYTRAEGLGADAVGGMLEDARGHLWISTTAGISRLDPATGKIENFNQRNGAQVAGYFVGAYGRLPDGRFVFGGLRGATVVDPAQVQVTAPPHRVAIIDFRPLRGTRNGRGVKITTDAYGPRRIVLNHQLDDFTLGLSALGYADPQAMSFDYRLDHHDADWVRTSAESRFATYTNLPSGEYVLRTRARVDGGPPGPESQLEIVLRPPPWRSPWALGAYAAAAGVLLGLIAARARRQLHVRRAAQRRLEESESRLKLALWGTGDELWDADLRTGKLMRINPLPDLEANQGVPDHSLDSYGPFIHPEDREQFLTGFRQHARGATAHFESVYRSRDTKGQWRWLRARGRGVEHDEDGHARRVVGTSEDITELKRHEEALEELTRELEERVAARTSDLTVAYGNLSSSLQELRMAQHQLVEAEKLAALGGLVAGIAHEINTPLGIGVTAASHLEGETRKLARRIEAGELGPAELEAFQRVARESSEIILRNLRRADKLVKSFKQVAVDQASEQHRKLDLGSYIDEILTSMHPALKKTRHRVVVDCPEHQVIDTYPGALYQILMNLVMNSLIHAFDGDRPGEIRIRARVERDEVEIRYSDDGRGMDAEQRRRVFEPFYTTRRGQGGSGLGMQIVYNLATQLLRGRIDLQSAPGQGVTVTLNFPAAIP